MTDSSSSLILDFGLLLYLEELNKDELNKFKLLLKEEPMKPGICQIPWTQVKKANREGLANLMNEYYSREQAWDMALKIFGKLKLKNLCERAKSELNYPVTGASQNKRPKDARVGDIQDENDAALGEGTEYRIRMKEKFCIMEDKECLLGEPEDFCHRIAKEDQKLLEHLFKVDVESGEQPLTVVLKGAAGIGKTTLMKKAMLYWAQGKLFQQFAYVFYLNAREINQLKERSFLQIISKDWPSEEGPIERIMSEPSRLLFIIDSFDELNFAFEEPKFALCKDWTQVHPVSFLMSSLLRKAMLPESTLLVTTKLIACKKLKSLLKSQCFVELQGMSENAREEYIYHFFEDKNSALQVFSLLKDNEMLFNMCKVPRVCWIICSFLKQQMEKDNILATCDTTTALFTCYISNLFTQTDKISPNTPNERQLRKLCHLALTGVWTMTYVFYKENVRKHGLTSPAISGFLNMNILQMDTECENCYVFTHLHIQEFFAALCYVLKESLEVGNYPYVSSKYVKLLIQSSTHKNPHLTKMKCFLFGLLNIDRIKQLENIFNCQMSLEVRQKILEWVEKVANSEKFLSQMELLELFQSLYETQDETFVCEAMKFFQKIVVNICEKTHLIASSFCLKYCHCLQNIKLSINLVSEKMINPVPETEIWKGDGGCISHCWQDLFSVLHTNDHLKQVDICNGHLDELAVKTLYQELKNPNCKLQKLMLRYISFPDGCQDIFHSLKTNQNLMHLDLKGSNIKEDGVKSLCEALKNPECKLQKLKSFTSLVKLTPRYEANLKDCLENCGFTVAGCKDLSLALIINKRLTHLCLADNVLEDDGIKFISDVLKEPQCTLQSLVLKNCHLTSLGGKYLSASLLQNTSLTHLDLGSNRLQDDGIKLLCAAFQNPCSALQDLQLVNCVLTNACCLDLVSAILNNPNLHSLDVGNNYLQDDGMEILNKAFRHPNCNIKRLGLECCGLTSVCCKELASVLSSNQKLVEINLAQNTLGCEGIMKLHAVLKSPDCKLQVLGLCKEAFDKEAQKLLKDVELSNPHLVIKLKCIDPNEDVSWWQCL